MQHPNPYQEILRESLPRLLNLYNLDPFSDAYGLGDRLHAGWKILDFPNGTMQGGIHSIAIAFRLGLIRDLAFVKQIIDAAIRAVPKVTAKNGAAVEAYPREHSFCVTALVAFDLLSAIDYLKEWMPKELIRQYLDLIAPLIEFLNQQDEEHAVISNHLATAVAAIALWNHLSKKQNLRYQHFLNIIYNHQSSEGWYQEYEGADPGYQTLCTYYLAAAYKVLKDQHILDSLKRSTQFLKYFIHPDASIGGLYGSRNTEVYYPGGIVLLTEHDEVCKTITMAHTQSLHSGIHIRPQDIDIGNYIPLLNSYAFAAFHYHNASNINSLALPFSDSFDIQFPKAGIYIHSNLNYYAIVNFKKGGTIKVFNKKDKVLDIEDGGLIGELTNGTKFSSQAFDPLQKFNNFELEARFTKLNEAYPGPFQFLVLRLLSLTIFRSVFLGNIFKRFIVKMLMTGKKTIPGKAKRKFKFQEDKIYLFEKIDAPPRTSYLKHGGKFRAIHMASSTYNTAHMFNTEESKFVEIKEWH